MPSEHMDQKAVQRASRKLWPKLIDAGVELYEYEPTMLHTKLMIVDSHFVSIGSANFDARSLAINDEANLNALDAGLAGQLEQIFQGDLRRAERMEKADAREAKPHEMLLQVLQTPLESQL